MYRKYKAPACRKTLFIKQPAGNVPKYKEYGPLHLPEGWNREVSVGTNLIMGDNNVVKIERITAKRVYAKPYKKAIVIGRDLR